MRLTDPREAFMENSNTSTKPVSVVCEKNTRVNRQKHDSCREPNINNPYSSLIFFSQPRKVRYNLTEI